MQHPSLSEYTRKNEKQCVEELLAYLPWSDQQSRDVSAKASRLIQDLRRDPKNLRGVQEVLQTYSLDTQEGLAIMALAESLLRVPDNATANLLIKDKIQGADWDKAKKDAGFLLKSAGLGLNLTQKTLSGAMEKIGAPVIREALTKVIRSMASQFVLGQDIKSAVKNAKVYEKKGYTLSYDILGEGARTYEDAQRYFEHYRDAMFSIAAPSAMSVKLSALHPRYAIAQADMCVPIIREHLMELCNIAAEKNISLTVDAEESERLDISLEIIQAISAHDFKGWQGFGLAVQAYQKRAMVLIDYLDEMAASHKRNLQVRLVKGAYWDREIKFAQVHGFSDYPVFTRKENTDVSYLACAHKMLKETDNLMPLFGTHNAQTVLSIIEMADDSSALTFQRLFGMGEELHDAVMTQYGTSCSIYAPVGPRKDLLAYLVRRLLENGANSSFVNQMFDEDIDPETLTFDPVVKARLNDKKHHPLLSLPFGIFEKEGTRGRKNSDGIDIYDPAEIADIEAHIEAYELPDTPINNFEKITKDFWEADVEERAQVLEKAADIMQKRMQDLIVVLVKEAQKTIPDAISEVREAIDFCRYYAGRGREVFSDAGQLLPSVTGERNVLVHEARGKTLCISPWNFPLAIFTGQVVAALMAGNAVVAKPAEQTPIIGKIAVGILHEAGVPHDVLQIAIGDGKIGARLVERHDWKCLAFTGSSEVARIINRSLAEKDGAICNLVAETGGLNTMIVDSSALPEQVVDDVITSAFGSAGQRCSALRLLCVQDDIADSVLEMLAGAMQAIRVGNPAKISTDVGSVIDEKAFAMLQKYKSKLSGYGKKVGEAEVPEGLEGYYIAPCAYEIKSVGELEREVFGPILHVVRFKRKNLDQLIADINASGYGLTFGVHSRIQSFHDDIARQMRVGNVYINRSMIGAVVGSQPFGGRGLSGTGPKAGGPHYLHAFATEKIITTDTTAMGGNATLVSLADKG